MSAPGIGVFGGTFNPIHVAHLRAAEEAREALALERVLFVPSADPPLKRGGPQAIAPAELRLAWVRRAVAGNPAFQVEPLELAREGPSYSVDTLRLLGERHGRERLVFLIGRDAFSELASWREPALLLTLSHFAVLTRPPAGPDGLAEWLPASLAGEFDFDGDGQTARHRRAGTWIRRVPIPALDVSATDLRRRVREGRSLRYLVPEVVRGEIEGCAAYRERTPGGDQ